MGQSKTVEEAKCPAIVGGVKSENTVEQPKEGTKTARRSRKGESFVHIFSSTVTQKSCFGPSLLFATLFTTLRSLQPFEEFFCRFADLLAGCKVDIFLASFGAPVLQNLFRHQISLIVSH